MTPRDHAGGGASLRVRVPVRRRLAIDRTQRIEHADIRPPARPPPVPTCADSNRQHDDNPALSRTRAETWIQSRRGHESSSVPLSALPGYEVALACPIIRIRGLLFSAQIMPLHPCCAGGIRRFPTPTLGPEFFQQ